MLSMSTSGSTGSPKLVRQSYQNVKSNTDAIIKYLKIKGSDTTITFTNIICLWTFGNNNIYSKAQL